MKPVDGEHDTVIRSLRYGSNPAGLGDVRVGDTLIVVTSVRTRTADRLGVISTSVTQVGRSWLYAQVGGRSVGFSLTEGLENTDTAKRVGFTADQWAEVVAAHEHSQHQTGEQQ